MYLVKRDTSTVTNADTAWILSSTTLVFLMVPGVGYFYSGMARSKNALSLIFLSMITLAVVSVQWFIWGYSLSYSETGGVFIGDLRHAFFMNVGMEPHPVAPAIPATVFAAYQCMFAAITGALAFGAAAERARLLPCLVFLFIWITMVYNPVAYWTWGPQGWLKTLGSLDFAGGTPVHICSGMAALAYALVVGRRKGYGAEDFKPHNCSHIMLGTALLWFGWFGFNAGSTFAANARSGMTALVTHLAAGTSGLTWCLLAYRHQRKLSSFHFCSGVVSGLVAITPGAGFVAPWAAFVIGLLAGTVCHFAAELKHRLKYDDALDVFAVHGVGGFLGNLLTGIFAQASMAALDGTSIPGGWVSGNWIQLPIQLAASVSGGVWSFVLTIIILYIMNYIPSMRLRADEVDEIMGMDGSQMGEYGYDFAAPSTRSIDLSIGPTPALSTRKGSGPKEESFPTNPTLKVSPL
ncbi:MAG: ammonium transporter AmtB-like domain-containing protein [Piptocephalis tieghemiana]|nr:MAG: ammonium transporter AmtB-like domain-containing protein [Piptocephalis tieghemiana]